MKPDKINKLIKRLAAVSLWLIIWQIASVMTGLELLLASPVTVLRTLAGMLVTRQFYGILYLSVMHIMSGMLAGCLIGICAGILSARFDFLKEWLGIAVQLMKSLPVAAFIILVLMWWGSKNVTFIISAMVVIPMITTGVKEGILFLDEINCISETLTPMMLQFLQGKTFGNQKVPEGWVIVTAGNPPEYNKSVREFDLVTLDRIKKIDVDVNYDGWKEYAYQADIHPAILAYLEIRRDYFYRMETTVDGRVFATARGWEDLSQLLKTYEKLGKKADREVVHQYIQHWKIAKDFANYLELFYKYRTDYQIDEVLNGRIDDILVKKAAHASFDEKLSVTGLLLSRLNKGFEMVREEEDVLAAVFDILKESKEPLMEGQREQPVVYLEDVKNRYQAESAARKKAGLLSREDIHHDQQVLDTLERYVMNLKKENVQDGEAAFAFLRQWFNESKEKYDEDFDQAARQLEYAFDFMESAFAGGQELVVFITELNTSSPAVSLLQEYSCERYYRYNKELLFRENTRDILERIRQLG